MNTLHFDQAAAQEAASAGKKVSVAVGVMSVASFGYLAWQLIFGGTDEVGTYVAGGIAGMSAVVAWLASRVARLNQEASKGEIEEEMDLLMDDLELREELAGLYAAQGNRVFCFQLDDIRRAHQARRNAGQTEAAGGKAG